MFGYSHFTGGFAGGQAEYVRVPLGDVNLLPLPSDVPDEQGLYLSDVLCTSWHCVVDTGVKEGDVVAIWGAGPIGQMCAEFAFIHGASKVILIDGGPGAWRLDYVKDKLPQKGTVETIDFSKLAKGESVVSTLKKMEHGGPDVALECVAGEYAKGWAHYFELMLGVETDSSEIVNEMIESVKSFGRCGITGVYAGYVRSSPVLPFPHPFLPLCSIADLLRKDESFQHRLAHGARRPAHRQRPGARAPVLGEVAAADPRRQDPPAGHAEPPRAHRRPG